MAMQLNYAEDTTIIREKAKNRHMYIVLEGTVALFSNYNTPEEYLIGLIRVGETFGEIGILNHDESLYTAVAVSDVKVVVFSDNELDIFMKNYPDQALGIMRSMARMIKILNANLNMVIEENKDFVKYKDMYLATLKQEANSEDKAIVEKWRLSSYEKNNKGK